MNIWKYNNNDFTEIPDNAIGFVYRLTNLSSGKMYIGKKNFYAAVVKQKTIILKTTGLKKKKKIRSKKESDWKEYHGSSESVAKDVLEQGEDNFKREIIRICYSKGELNYYEAYYQIIEDVLLKPDMYYNNWISFRTHRLHLKNILVEQPKTVV